MSPRRLTGLLAIVTLCLIALCIAYAAVVVFLVPLSTNQSAKNVADPSNIFKVYKGDSLRTLAYRLREKGINSHAMVLEWYGRLIGDSARLKRGEYQLEPGETIHSLLARIVAGDVLVREFQITEGWTFRQVKDALVHDRHLKHDTILLSEPSLVKKLGAIHPSLEGLLFPDTYAYEWGDSDFDIVARAYYRMQHELSQQWQQRAADLPYKTAYSALIVASMIEKETAIDRERPEIAGVILRRLKKRMRLQIDPTVVYGMGAPYGTRLTRTNLKTDTPYNTYTRYGLPPTPIDMPGLASIHAAMHPSAGTSLYYVAKDDGSHQFSDTYEQHRIAVQRYQR